MKTLNDIALFYGTDKSIRYHNYAKIYPLYFEPIRMEKLKILEIGIDKGYSLKSWEEYFPNAEITGIDIVDLTYMEKGRVHVVQGDQKDAAMLKRVHEQYGPFDIIIDDGSHMNADMQASFECLFPLLKEGGIYVVEDLHACYWSMSHGDDTTVFIDTLKKMVDYVNSSGKSGAANIQMDEKDYWYQQHRLPPMDWWEKHVEFIHLYRSIVFLKKYPPLTTDTIAPNTSYLIVSGTPPLLPTTEESGLSTTAKIKKKIKSASHLFKKIREDKSAFEAATVMSKLLLKNVSSRFDPFVKKRSVSKELHLSAKDVADITEYRKKIKIYDAFLFFNELDLLDIRLHILNSFVDYFVIVESTETFSGLPKKLYYEENKQRFAKYQHKIIHYVIRDTPKDRKDLEQRLEQPELKDSDREVINDTAATDTIPQDQNQWLREFYQKESIKKAFSGKAQDDDICFISDVDEIWNPKILIDYRIRDVFKMNQKMYAYYLNNRSDEQWSGTYATKYYTIKNNSINHLDNPAKTAYTQVKDGGWHFTNMGGAEEIRKKLESYGHQEYNTVEIKKDIDKKIAENKDFIGRNFKFWVDEKDLPKYITDNKEKYKSLFK